MAKSTALIEKEAEAVPQPEPEPAQVCGTCRHWEARNAAFGICNLSGKYLPGPMSTTNAMSCAAWQTK